MKTFELNIFDEQLYNGGELRKFLEENPGPICVSTNKEGPSLGYTGVLAILDEHCERTGRDPNTITILTSNVVEEHRYARRTNLGGWWYWSKLSYQRTDVTPTDLRHRRFACLIGRKNPERLAMLYWLRTKDCLLSSMEDPDFRPELQEMDKVIGWIKDHKDLCQWIHSIDIGSLDGYTVRDQYRAKDPSEPEWGKTHMALLDYYHNFDIEIIPETWTRGITFFPTEKTVRPLLAGKPFIMYGARHWMKHLRDMGFMTWGDCWDQSYDDYEGLERWKRMKEVIDGLNKLPSDEFHSIMMDANEIARHNQDILLEKD